MIYGQASVLSGIALALTTQAVALTVTIGDGSPTVAPGLRTVRWQRDAGDPENMAIRIVSTSNGNDILWEVDLNNEDSQGSFAMSFPEGPFEIQVAQKPLSGGFNVFQTSDLTVSDGSISNSTAPTTQREGEDENRTPTTTQQAPQNALQTVVNSQVSQSSTQSTQTPATLSSFSELPTLLEESSTSTTQSSSGSSVTSTRAVSAIPISVGSETSATRTTETSTNENVPTSSAVESSLVPISAAASGSGPNIGAIVGGVIGTLAFITAVMMGLFVLLRRRRRQRQSSVVDEEGKQQHSQRESQLPLVVSPPPPLPQPQIDTSVTLSESNQNEKTSAISDIEPQSNIQSATHESDNEGERDDEVDRLLGIIAMMENQRREEQIYGISSEFDQEGLPTYAEIIQERR